MELPTELPPLHPILVNFTAALIPVSIVFDFLGRLTKKESLHAAGWWTLLAASVITPLTVLAGWLGIKDLSPVDQPHAMIYHQWIGTALAVGLIPLAAWRGQFARRSARPSFYYLAVAALLLMGLIVQCEIGLWMTFGDQEANSEQPATTETTPANTQEGGDMQSTTSPASQDSGDGDNEKDEKPSAVSLPTPSRQVR